MYGDFHECVTNTASHLDSLLQSIQQIYVLNACCIEGCVLSTVWDIITHKTQIPQSRTSNTGRGENIYTQIMKHNRESVECFKNNNRRGLWGRME